MTKNAKYISFLAAGFALGAFTVFTLFYLKTFGDQENLFISHPTYIFGIDVSAYQEKINWNKVSQSHHPIKYVFTRATMGKDGIDDQFNHNWNSLGQLEYLRGAYHYYRPNENSTEQFQNFSKIVTLSTGDFPPVLDVEKESQFGKDNLVEGVQNWLQLAEKHYGIKPIVYTGLDFYLQNLKGKIDAYPLWIAAYSGKSRVKKVNWTFHQFTENVRVKGIKGSVDGNDFNGSIEALKALRIP